MFLWRYLFSAQAWASTCQYDISLSWAVSLSLQSYDVQGKLVSKRLELLSIDAFTTSSGVSHKIATLESQREILWDVDKNRQLVKSGFSSWPFSFPEICHFQPEICRLVLPIALKRLAAFLICCKFGWLKHLAKSWHSRQRPYGCFNGRRNRVQQKPPTAPTSPIRHSGTCIMKPLMIRWNGTFLYDISWARIHSTGRW